MSNSKSKNYWERFYLKGEAPKKPSDFAVKCRALITEGSKILDIGCGNCRDSNYLADVNSVIAIDGNTQDHYASKNVFLIKSNIEDLCDIKCDYVYSRFFIHAVTEEVEDLFWSYIMRNSRYFLVEARSDRSSFEGDHYRRFINKPNLERKLSSFGLEFSIVEDRGMAKMEGEDPYIIRIFGCCSHNGVTLTQS